MMPSGLWRNHEATAHQQEIAFPGRRRRLSSRLTQADVLLGMLREARHNRRPLELPEIMQAGIAQHGARLVELRERGFVIENEMERVGGRVLSRYWLRHDPERDGAR